MPARIIAILVGLSLLTSCAQEMSWEGYNDAAVEAYEQARYAEAEELLLEALREAEKFEEQAPRLTTSLNNLALLYLGQDRFAEAEPLFQRSLAIAEKVLGPEHPDMATSLNNVALVYYNQGKHAKAEPLYR